MRGRWFALPAALLLALVAGCTGSDAGPDGDPGPDGGPGPRGGAVTGSAVAVDPGADTDRVCDADRCLSLSRLSTRLQARLRDRVVGSVVLLGRGGVQATGLARTAVDPPQRAMTAGVPTNVASVSKLYTTITLLKALAEHHRSVDSPIAPFLPVDWSRGPGVDTITFRDLLTHHSGFRLDSDYTFRTPDAAREQIKDGISLPDKQTADYNNLNFAIVRDLFPRLAGARDPGPERRRAAADRLLQRAVQRSVFTPAKVRDAICAPVPAAMLMYPTVTSLSSTITGTVPPSAPTGCAQGGWNLTPTAMRQVLIALIEGRLLTRAERRELDKDCLGWDCSVGKQIGFRGKQGTLDEDSATLQTYSAILVGQVPLVIVVNSFPGDSLSTIVAGAVADATVTRPPP